MTPFRLLRYSLSCWPGFWSELGRGYVLGRRSCARKAVQLIPARPYTAVETSYRTTQPERPHPYPIEMPAHDYDPAVCMEYCCSDFRTLAEDDAAANTAPDLSNPIHPLFERAKFTNLTDAGYDALKWPLKLASRILRDQRAMEFIVTTMDGSLHNDHPREEDPGPERSWEELDACEPNSEKPTTRLLRYPRPADLVKRADPVAHIRYRATAILQHLANVLESIEIGKIDSAGTTMIYPTEEIPLVSRWMFPRAGKADMVLSSDKVCWEFDPAEEPLANLMNSYQTARVIVHEIAHVLNKSVNGDRKEEVFHGNSCCDEAGYAFEKVVFGGIAGIHDLNLSYTEHEIPGEALISVSYPNQHHIKLHGTDSPIAQRWYLDEWITSTRIPWHFIARMFTDKFWAEEVPLMVGPIQPQPDDRFRWLTKFVQRGETFVTSDGSTATATKSNTVVTCSTYDPDLPTRVGWVYRDIIQSQDRRRDAREAARLDSAGGTQ